MWSPFSPARPETAVCLTAIGDKFNWTVTRDNYLQIIEECKVQFAELKKSRPVDDKSRTAEEDAAINDQIRQREQQRQADEHAKQSAAEALAQELRAQYPWATPERAGLSRNARVGQNIRAELAAKFSGTNFSVTTDHNSVRVRWGFGPTEKQIAEVTAKYKDSYVDTQDVDASVRYDRSVQGRAMDIVLGRVSYVSLSRDYHTKPEIWQEIAKLMCLQLGRPFTSIDERGLIDGDNDTLSDHIWRLLARTPFPAGEWKITGLVESKSEDPHAWCDLVLEETVPPVSPATSASGVSVRYNREHDGVEISFPGKPAPEVLAKCKGYGFRWSMRSKVWYKRYTEMSWIEAHKIAGIQVAATPKEEQGPDRFDMAVENQMAAQCGLA